MNDEFIKNVLGYGEKGRAWLKEIPDIINRIEQKWELHVRTPYTLSYNYVAPVEQKDGTQAVIKIGMPWEKEFFNGIEALKLFNGHLVPRLLREDKENAAILIEEITPGNLLSTIDDDEQTMRILASIIKSIHQPLPENHSFITLFAWTKELREYPKKKNPTIPTDIIKEGIQLFEYLLTSSQPAVLTHADLHHENVLSSDSHGWVAIDPKGIAAEPLYDVAALIRGPYKKLKAMDHISLDTLLKRRIEILSDELDNNPKRIFQWCLAQTILSRVWTEGHVEYSAYGKKLITSLKRIENFF